MELLDFILSDFRFYRRWRGGKWYANPHCVLGGTAAWVRWETSHECEDYTVTPK